MRWSKHTIFICKANLQRLFSREKNVLPIVERSPLLIGEGNVISQDGCGFRGKVNAIPG